VPGARPIAPRRGYGRAVDPKQAVRERVWRTLEDEGAARFPGARGRIPNFRGAEAAAERLAQLPEWEAAAVVKSNPDAPQLPVRRWARRHGKTLYMAVPRLADDKPFVRVAGDPTIKKALAEGEPARVEDLGHVELVVCGTVAVNRAGVRVGKGGGYSDLELGLLVEAGLVDDATTIVTTVHPLQLLDEELPETTHDFRVDIIVTPDEVLRTDARRRSPGVIWEHLDDETVQAIPVLAARRPRERSPGS
jgi:5-formyltetrahydrofolate cyclo-ligase